MFISKSSHQKILQVYEARILDLQSQIADLRKLSIPRQTSAVPTLVDLEANAILSNRDTPIEISESQLKELEEQGHEASRIFMGTYDYTGE